MTTTTKTFTPKELARREADCKIDYCQIVPDKRHKELDAERLEQWITPTAAAELPQWVPKRMPAIQAVIESASEEVTWFMTHVAKDDRQAVVKKLMKKIMKAMPSEPKDLIESLLWGALFTLQKEQGVTLKAEISKKL